MHEILIEIGEMLDQVSQKLNKVTTKYENTEDLQKLSQIHAQLNHLFVRVSGIIDPPNEK